MSWYGKLNFLPAPHLVWYIDSQIPEKWFLIVLKKINGGRRKLRFLYPLSEKILRPMASKVDVMKFRNDLMYDPLDS